MSPASELPLVLVVDDDDTLRFLVSEALDGAGFAVREASDGEEGVALAAALRPDLVLLDVVMPGPDGFETCARLRQLPGGRDLPVLMMTGTDDLDAIRRAFDAGATDFVTKPINYVVLGYRLRYMQRARDRQRELRLSRQRLSDAQRVARLGHWDWAVVEGPVCLGDESANILGLDRPCHTVSDLFSSVHPDDRQRVLDAVDQFLQKQDRLQVEHRILRPGGTEAIVVQQAEAAVDEATGRLRFTGTFQDITERKQAERRIAQLERTDALTGLPNRVAFVEAVRDHLGRAESKLLAVYELSIEQLPRIRDSLGHPFSQALERLVAERLAAAFHQRPAPSSDVSAPPLGPGPLLARDPSGALLLAVPGLATAEQALVPTRGLLSALEPPFTVEDTTLHVTGSLGVALAPLDATEAEALLGCARAARTSSRAGPSFRFYAKSMNEEATERVRLENALRRAVEGGEFRLMYQPKVHAQDGRPVGMEALVRWTDPELGPVSPGKFVPLAEELGLVIPIGTWVLTEACRQLAVWDRLGVPALSCAVNVAAQQLDAPDFEDVVKGALAEAGLGPGRIELELTESALSSDPEAAVDRLERLRKLGCRIALDDFGTGYSSLSYLNRFPLDVVKLDRSFVLDVPGSQNQSSLVAALVDLLCKLDLEVVAEGVETTVQAQFLAEVGCEVLQGFLFSRPLEPEALVRWARGELEAAG